MEITKNPPNLSQKNTTGELYIYQNFYDKQRLIYLIVCTLSNFDLFFHYSLNLSFPTVFSKIEKKAVILDSQFSSEMSPQEIAQFASDCNNNKENLRKQLGVIRTCQFLRTN